MKLTDEEKDLFASLAVGLLCMILFILLMGTVALWGQSAGQRVRSRLSAQPVLPADTTVDLARSPRAVDHTSSIF